jgi:class 3 adenylate cyclase
MFVDIRDFTPFAESNFAEDTVSGDTIPLPQQTVDALALRPNGLLDRGAHELKGKAAAVRVYPMGQR